MSRRKKSNSTKSRGKQRLIDWYSVELLNLSNEIEEIYYSSILTRHPSSVSSLPEDSSVTEACQTEKGSGKIQSFLSEEKSSILERKEK